MKDEKSPMLDVHRDEFWKRMEKINRESIRNSILAIIMSLLSVAIAIYKASK